MQLPAWILYNWLALKAHAGNQEVLTHFEALATENWHYLTDRIIETFPIRYGEWKPIPRDLTTDRDCLVRYPFFEVITATERFQIDDLTASALDGQTCIWIRTGRNRYNASYYCALYIDSVDADEAILRVHGTLPTGETAQISIGDNEPLAPLLSIHPPATTP